MSETPITQANSPLNLKPQPPLSIFKANLLLKLYGFLKIPLLSFVNPKCVEISPNRTVIKIKLRRRTKNHLNVMYFGALSIGAELCIALGAVIAVQQSRKRIDIVFKDFKANFLTRCDDDVLFICDEADQIRALIEKASTTSERVEQTFKAYSTVPSSSGDEKVATYEMTLSVRNRSKAV